MKTNGRKYMPAIITMLILMILMRTLLTAKEDLELFQLQIQQIHSKLAIVKLLGMPGVLMLLDNMHMSLMDGRV